jgi:hypothetical protein
MAETKLNLHQKLIEVRKSCPYLQKENSGYQFKYVSSSQVILALKAQMDTQGILLTQEVTEVKVGDHQTKKGDHEYFTEVWVKYTWINAEDPKQKLELTGYGQGLDNGEKGVGKAMTYAEKYFFLKQFNIPTDKDDPDANQTKPNNGNQNNNQPPPDRYPTDARPPAAPKTNGVTTDQLNNIARVLMSNGVAKSDILKFVSFQLSRDVFKSTDITFDEANTCVRALTPERINELQPLVNPPPPPAADKGPDTRSADDDLPF